LEVVFTANHLTDTDKQNSTEKYTNYIQLTKYSKTQVQSPLMKLGQDTKSLYSTMFAKPTKGALEVKKFR